MRIGVDATAVSAGEGTGMQSYAFNLARNLLALDDENEYVVYCRQEIPEAFRPHSGKAEFKVCGLSKRKLCEQLWLSGAVASDHLDVLHCICSLPLIQPKAKTVLTVHGLSWRITPEVFTTSLRWYWILTAERTMRKADRLIAITQWTKNLVRERLGVPTDRIDVVHHGVDAANFSVHLDAKRSEEVRHKYSLPDRFIVHVGTLIPVKNLPRLVRAFARLISDPEFADYHLVLVGGKGWGERDLHRAIAEVNAGDRVRLTGFVPTEDLPYLYGAADLFVFPSLYEGFGIPMIESFASGTPVVSSDASCLPEVGGEAAYYVDARREDRLTEGMARVLSDPDLRNELIRKGFERVPEFSWRKTAEGTLAAYERACRGA